MLQRKNGKRSHLKLGFIGAANKATKYGDTEITSGTAGGAEHFRK